MVISERMRRVIAVVVGLALLAVFFADFVGDIEHYVAGRQIDPNKALYTGDWDKERTYYASVAHQVFSLGRFPHFQLSQFQGTHALFANPEVSVLSPVTLLLPLLPLNDFFAAHLLVHYVAGLLGVVLLGRLFRLPAAAAVLGFVLLAFNGRVLVHYWAGHSQFITYTLVPYVLYFYVAAVRRRHSLPACALGTGGVMALMFFEGGVHIVNWTVLLFALAALVHIAEAVLTRTGCNDAELDERPLIAAARAHLVRPAVYLGLSALLFALIAAVKILPGLTVVTSGMSPELGDYQPGYASFGRLLETFMHVADDRLTPLAFVLARRMNAVESYNFIGPEATLLAVAALFYALVLSSDADLRRLAIASAAFLVLGLGYTYRNLLHGVPLLTSEGVAGRMTMMPLASLALIVPVFVDRVLLRLSRRDVVREAGHLVIALVIFARLFAESRKWMIPAGGLHTEYIPLDPGPESTDPRYWTMFWLGSAITIATATALAAVFAFRKRPFVARRLEWLARL